MEDYGDANLIDDLGSGSNDYFGLTNEVVTPTPTLGSTSSGFFGWLNSSAASVSGTALSVANAESGINAVLNGGNQPAAQAAHAATVARQQGAAAGSVSAGNLFSADGVNNLFRGLTGNPTLLLLLVAVGAYFYLRH